MKTLFTRRNVVIGAGGVAVVAAAGVGGHYLLHKRYAPSPYDDLLALLDNRDGDAQLGEAVLPTFDDFDAKKVAQDVRGRLAHSTLADVSVADARDGRVLEAKGWVIPQTLGLLCALAATAG